MVEIFADEIEDEIGVDVILVFLVLVDGEDEATAFLILGVLPLGLDAFLEKLKRVDAPPFLFHQITAWRDKYLCCLQLLCNRKLSRLLSLQ